jgi:hypothetical protein
MATPRTVSPARPAAPRQDDSSRRSRVQASRSNGPAAPLTDWAQRQAQMAGPRVALAPAGGVVELKGSATFAPPAPVAEYLAAKRRPTPVDVRFGTLAAGSIQVRRSRDRYDTPGEPQAISLVHPALDPLVGIGVLPVLAVAVRNSVVTGYVTIAQGKRGTPGGRNAVFDIIRKQSAALGWVGLNDLALPSPVNKLEAGTLTLQTDLRFGLGGFLKGSGRFGVIDETIAFTAQANANVAGLAKVDLDITRRPDGTLAGKVDVPLTYRNFSGRLVAMFAGGVVDVLGTARYTTQKLSGEVTLQVTDQATAREVAKRLLPPAALQAEAAQAAGAAQGSRAPAPAGPRPGARAVIGWGTLNAHFSEWLTGSATVIIDGNGNVTVVGRIAPPAVVPLFKTGVRRRIIEVNPRFGFGVPYVARAYVGAKIWLGVVASIEGKLQQIEIVGVYSTDPAIFNEFSIAATLLVVAMAGLEGGVGVEGGLELLGHDVSIGAGIDLIAGIVGKLEARPTIAYREVADPQAGRRGEFSIGGYVEIAAQPFLGLSGKAWIKLDSPWWSPAPNRTWPKDLFSKEYMLGGPFGFGADFVYVLGSGRFPELKPREPKMDGKALMSDLMDDNVPTGSRSKGSVPAKWTEKKPPSPPAAAAPPPARPAKTRPDQKPVAPRPQDKARWTGAMTDLRKLADDARARPYGDAEIERALGRVRTQYGLQRLDAKPNGSVWDVYAKLGETTNDAKPVKIRRSSAEAAGAPGATGPQKPPGPTRDLRELAGQMVAKRAAGQHPDKEINEVVATVRNELRPKGLKRLDFERPDAQGDSYLIAQASKPKRVGKKSRPPRPPSRTVVLRATLRFDVDVRSAVRGLPEQFQPIRIPRPSSGSVGPGAVGEQLAAWPRYAPRDQPKAGAAVLQPTAGAKELEVVAWNSGFPVPKTVRSHAEAFFLEWLDSVRLTGLKELVLNINLSPCSRCAETLRSIVPDGFTARLNYSIPYEGRDDETNMLHENATTTDDLDRLRKLGWQVTGTTPVKWTNASKAAERAASTSLYHGNLPPK